MGECASKFWMGSTLPLVEMRLRMAARSAVVVRIFCGACRVNRGITARAATTPAMSQFRRLREGGWPFELWLLVAKRLWFLVFHGSRCGRERTSSINLTFWRARKSIRRPEPLLG